MKFGSITVLTVTATTAGAIPSSGNTFVVPTAASGSNIVTATDGTNSPTATFTVTAPTLTLSPTSGGIGAVISVSGSNYVPSGSVVVKFGSTAILTLTATSSGAIPSSGNTFVVPTATSGSQTVTASDGTNTATASFTVSAPTLTLNPTSGAQGSTVTVSGANYVPGGTVMIKFDSTTMLTLTATASGAIPSTGNTFTVSSFSGSHSVTASDGINSATATFAISNPLLARVQGPVRQTSTSSSFTVTLSSTPTSGNVLIAVIGTYYSSISGSPRTVSSISETGVTWTKQAGQTDSQGSFPGTYTDSEIWLGTVNSGVSTSITITLSGSASSGAVADVCEYSGIAPSSYLDKTAGTTGSGTSTSTGTTTATSQASELWIGGVTVEASATQSSPTNGFTNLDGATYSSTSVSYLEKVVSATGTANSGTTISSNRYAGCIATFKAAYTVYTTTTILSVISTPLNAAQTGVSFSGSVSSGTAVPNGVPVVLQYSTSSSGPWTTAATISTTGGTGAFSGYVYCSGCWHLLFPGLLCAGCFGLQFVADFNLGSTDNCC